MRENKNKSVAQDCDKIPKTPCLGWDRSMINFCCRAPYVIRLEWDHIFCSSMLSYHSVRLISSQFLIGWWDEQSPGPWIYSEWSESRSVVSDSLLSHGQYSSWNSPGQYTRVGSHSTLQEIFPTQGSNPGLPHCRQILYQLSHQGSPEYIVKQHHVSPGWHTCGISHEGKKMKFCLVSITVIWGFLILWKLTLEMYNRSLIVTRKILSALMGRKYLT